MNWHSGKPLITLMNNTYITVYETVQEEVSVPFYNSTWDMFFLPLHASLEFHLCMTLRLELRTLA